MVNFDMKSYLGEFSSADRESHTDCDAVSDPNVGIKYDT